MVTMFPQHVHNNIENMEAGLSSFVKPDMKINCGEKFPRTPFDQKRIMSSNNQLIFSCQFIFLSYFCALLMPIINLSHIIIIQFDKEDNSILTYYDVLYVIPSDKINFICMSIIYYYSNEIKCLQMH